MSKHFEKALQTARSVLAKEGLEPIKFIRVRNSEAYKRIQDNLENLVKTHKLDPEAAALAMREGWGSDPLSDPYFEVYRDNLRIPDSPKHLRVLTRSRALDDDATEAEKKLVDELYPEKLDSKEQQQQEVWEAWANDEPIYDPRNLITYFKSPPSYSQWCKQHNLPTLLTYKELAWLVDIAVNGTMRLKAGAKDALRKLADKGKLQHPFPTGLLPEVKTKVGKTYGTWQLLSCLSESELTTNNRDVRYKATCKVCGLIVDSFSYRRVGHPCPSCESLNIAANNVKAQNLKHNIVIYKMEDGNVVISPNLVEGAVAKAVVFAPNIKAYWEDLVGEEQETVKSVKVNKTQLDDLLKLKDLPDF